MKHIALFLILIAALAGCLGSSDTTPEDDEYKGADGKPPNPGPGSTSPGDPGTPPGVNMTLTMDLEGVDCLTRVASFPVDRNALQAILPIAIEANDVPFVAFQSYECDSFVLGNTSVQSDAWFAVVVAGVKRPTEVEGNWDQTEFLLEILTDWPELAWQWGAYGVPAHEAMLTVEASNTETKMVVTAETLEYGFTAAPQTADRTNFGATRVLTLAGSDGEGRFSHVYVWPDYDRQPTVILAQTTGGSLGAVVGDGAGLYASGDASMQINEIKIDKSDPGA